MADCALGNQYLQGLGVRKDPARAFALCKKSAEKGVADAQTDLGQMYLSGNGTGQNYAEAARWFRKAADQGQANAGFLLGTMYWNGDGVESNRDEAAKLWQMSAQHGNPSAPAQLAKYYFTSAVKDNGIVIEPATQAAYWGTVASRTDPDATARQDSQKLVDLLYGQSPDLKTKVDDLLARTHAPVN
jgi:TPR repeat protein